MMDELGSLLVLKAQSPSRAYSMPSTTETHPLPLGPGSGQCTGCWVLVFHCFPFALAQVPPPGQRTRQLTTLTLEMEVGTVGVSVALPVVLQAAVYGQLLRLTVPPISHVMTFTVTLVLALWEEWKR